MSGLLSRLTKSIEVLVQPIVQLALLLVGRQLANQGGLRGPCGAFLAELDSLSSRRLQAGRSQPLAHVRADVALPSSSQQQITLDTWRCTLG